MITCRIKVDYLSKVVPCGTRRTAEKSRRDREAGPLSLLPCRPYVTGHGGHLGWSKVSQPVTQHMQWRRRGL